MSRRQHGIPLLIAKERILDSFCNKQTTSNNEKKKKKIEHLAQCANQEIPK